MNIYHLLLVDYLEGFEVKQENKIKGKYKEFTHYINK